MKQINISDITMKQATANWQLSLSFREKIELCRILDGLNVNVIELNTIINEKADSLLIKSISDAVENSTLAVPVTLIPLNVQTAAKALSNAKKKRLQVIAPVSTVQMEYKYHKKPDKMLDVIINAIKECKKYAEDVEFIASDATRSEYDFLCQAVQSAVEAGVSTVTICDDAGVFLPFELYEFINKLRDDVQCIENISLAVSCSNELALADACAISAVRTGAVSEIKTAAYPVNTASLHNITKLLTRREDVCEARTSIKTTRLKREITKIDDMLTNSAMKSSPLVNTKPSESESIELTFNDNKLTVNRAIKALGYDLNEEDKNRVWDAFTAVAVHKQSVGARELEAIIASRAMQVPTTYVLEGYVISASSSLGATAHVKLRINGKTMDAIAAGDGPIDAAYMAIEQCIGSNCELDDFQIRAVTQGREAMGEAITRLRCNGKLYSGRGISTDITEASIEAYVNALNKIAYEEDLG